MERSEGEAGYTLSSAPESIKKYRPDRRSKTDMEEGLVSLVLVVLVGKPAAFIDNRLDRFPRPWPVAVGLGPASDTSENGMNKPWLHIWHGRSTSTGLAAVAVDVQKRWQQPKMTGWRPPVEVEHQQAQGQRKRRQWPASYWKGGKLPLPCLLPTPIRHCLQLPSSPRSYGPPPAAG